MTETSNCFSAEKKLSISLAFMNLSQTGSRTWTTKIRLKLLHLMIQTAQEHSMQHRYWKQDDYKKKTTMFHENVSDCKTNSWQKQDSSIHRYTRANKDVKIRINNSNDVKNMTTWLIRRQDGSGIKSREACRKLRLRRLHHGRIPLGKNGILGGGILQNMMMSSECLLFN